jgi:serine protease Do
MKTKRAFVSGAFGSVAASAILLTLHQGGLLPAAAAADRTSPRIAPKIVLNTNALPKDTRGITSFAPVVKRVAPSVVTIYSSKVVRQDLQSNPFFNDPFFRRFFGGPDEEEEPGAGPGPGPRGGRRMQPAPRQREQTQQSLGSGVIITADGYILSNNHVVEGADEVKVALSESEDEYIAKVIGTDPQTDISVLKIDAKNLSPITMTDSDYLQVGDVVLAVGNPFGVGQTVTMGIVSATGRGKFGIVDYEDFIQTDAAVNRGNSGGALVDAEGRLVGINTAIISPTGGSIGIGFAVPVNMARRVMDSIVQNGKVTRGYLGVFIQDVTPQLAKQFNLKDRNGALVGGVPEGTPAAKAGLQPGDVITEYNGRRVPDSRQLRLWVSQTPPNTKATFKLLREGKERTVNMTLGELPTEMAGGPPGRRTSPTAPKSDALDGVEVSDLDQRTRRQMEIPPNVQGALVTAVDPNSTAAEAGLKQGDVIVEINRQKVANAQEAIELSDKIKSNEQILLRVWSGGRGGGGTRYIVVEPEKPSKSRERNQE